MNKKYLPIMTAAVVCGLILTAGRVSASNASLPLVNNPFDDLQVSIPGMARFSEVQVTDTGDGFTMSVNWIAEYIMGIYNYAIAIIGILAVLAIAIGGVMWAMSFGNPSIVTEGKAWITGAILGLVLALGSYILLNTINADLVRMRPINLGYLDNDEVDPYDEPGSQDQSCYLNTFGSSEAAVRARLKTVNCPALGGNIRVHELAVSAFTEVCKKITEAGKQNPSALKTTCGTALNVGNSFNWRLNRNNKRRLSLHSFGIAWDINPFDCGECDNLRRKANGECPCKVILPRQVIDAFKSVPGFRWGGDYSSRCDNMHFEWLGPCQS